MPAYLLCDPSLANIRGLIFCSTEKEAAEEQEKSEEVKEKSEEQQTAAKKETKEEKGEVKEKKETETDDVSVSCCGVFVVMVCKYKTSDRFVHFHVKH